MSCRSTALNSVTTSLARMGNDDLTDSQVQSLFHSLKRSSEAAQTPNPLPGEFDDHLERLSFLIRNDSLLTPGAKGRLLGRLESAPLEPLPDGKTWYAASTIVSAAGTAQTVLDGLYSKVGETLRVEGGKVRMMMNEWRDAGDSAFEDRPAPDPEFRYDLIDGLPTDEGTQRALRKLGYEHFLAQRYPVFVYGTLRQGQGNNHLLDDAYTAIQPGRVRGCSIYGGHWGFPYASPSDDPDAVTVGEVVWLRDDHTGDTARYLMDSLEGFHSDRPSTSHYDRVRVDATVHTPTGVRTVPVWMYVAGTHTRERLATETPIEHGDWVTARREHLGSRYT